MISNFTRSGKKIAIVNGRVPPGATLGIVDASFNPPNRAHAQLVSILRDFCPTCCIVLLLATGNADKPAAPLQQLQVRYEMIKLLANEINGPVCIALSTEPYFIAKAEALKREFPDSQQLFAMGADTLLRLYDQKYYKEDVSQVMRRLFGFADIIALTRNQDALSGNKTIDMRQFAANCNVHIVNANESTDLVSSSRARQAFLDGNWQELSRVVPDSIAEYIRRNDLYQPAGSNLKF